MADGLEEKISRYGNRLYGLCIRLCGGKSDADDLYQETWLRVCGSFGRYDPSHPFEPWLTAICVNCYRDSLRRRQFERLIAAFDDGEARDSTMNSVAAENHDEEDVELWEAVRRLPEKYRTAIILHYFRGYDVRELSFILKIPEGTHQVFKELTDEDGDIVGREWYDYSDEEPYCIVVGLKSGKGDKEMKYEIPVRYDQEYYSKFKS